MSEEESQQIIIQESTQEAGLNQNILLKVGGERLVSSDKISRAIHATNRDTAETI